MTPDLLGPPFEAQTLELPADDEGQVVATLVRHRGPDTSRRAVLYVHGYTDYFFQRELAEFWVEAGYHFYALDLRKCGRSLRPHQTQNMCADLHEYFAELDMALDIIAEDGAEALVLNGHSTGGLLLSLYAHERRPKRLQAVVLNSPFFELAGPWFTREVLTEAVSLLANIKPYALVPIRASSAYGKSLHADHSGEWPYDLAWKPLKGVPVRAGWLAAVHRGHEQVQAGLDISAPVLVLHSARSVYPDGGRAQVPHADAILDVRDMRRFGVGLGPSVTLAAIDGGLHDLVLSAPAVRAEVYAAMSRWLGAYGPRPLERSLSGTG